MKISRLTLYNFGIYAGINTFDLCCDKPVILIGGMNGRGKTTILEAILIGLYGRRSFAFDESGLSFPAYLKRLVNTADGINTAKVELEFTLSEENTIHTYLVIREWNLLTQIPYLKTTVLKNSVYDQLLSESWDLFIEEILPNAIAPFFFFDGEKISDLANSNDDAYMKDSIKSLLGISVIETAINDIQRIIKKKKKSNKFESHSKELMEYEAKVSKADAKLKSAKEEAGQLDVKRIQLENELNIAENKFAAMGGSLATNRKKLLDKQIRLDENLDRINAAILEMAAEDLPLLMTMPLLVKILDAATVEKERRNIQSALEQLPSLFRSYDKNKHLSLNVNVEDFIEYVRNKTSDTPPVYNLTDHGYFQLQTLCSTLQKKKQQEATELLLSRRKILAEKEEIENYLSIDVNESEAGMVYKDILSNTAKLATVNEQLRSAKAIKEACNAQFEELSRQQAKVIEKAVGDMEGADDEKRTMIYAGYSIDILQDYKVRLQSQKINLLAVTMSDCLRRLVSKQNLIEEIKIDENTLQFHYYNDKGEIINHSSFSAGEKQLLVIAMLWALGICSKKQFPVIIDTPLARLDSVHRKALITNYIPKASEQIILLSTDEEIYGEAYQLLAPHIGKEYTLQYDEDTKQSSIEMGYFGGQIK